jgi:hypothetical protein
MFRLVLLSASVSTVHLATLKFQANKHPPLAISPQAIVLPANSANRPKPCTVLYMFLAKKDTAMPTKATYPGLDYISNGTSHITLKLLQKFQVPTFIVLHWVMGHSRE